MVILITLGGMKRIIEMNEKVENVSSLKEIVEEKRMGEVVEGLEPKDMDAPKAPQEKLTLKPFPDHLKYAYLGKESTKPIILSTSLTSEQEESC